MRNALLLNDWKTKVVLNRYGLTPEKRLGRGKFCAVYDAGSDRVIKLTTSALQYESARDYLHGEHLPGFIDDEGYVGTQHNGLPLYLYTAERLAPMAQADRATQRLARRIVRRSNAATVEFMHSEQYAIPTRQRRSEKTRFILQAFINDEGLPRSLREAFECILSVAQDYEDVMLDIYSGNLMVRNKEELVLNDIVLLHSEYQQLIH